MRDNDLGIYCTRTRKFYYLETGDVYVANTIDRIKKALIKRGLIEFTDKTFIDTENYRVFSCKDARLKDMEMLPIYISKHIQQTVEQRKLEEETKTKTWG